MSGPFDFNPRERIWAVSIVWQVQSIDGAIYVREVVGKSLPVVYGPITTEEIANAFVEERRKFFNTLLSSMISAGKEKTSG